MSGSPSGLIPKTNNSSLGLGAAGGPRGFAAGATQVLVNFFLNYNAEALRQLSSDLQKNNAAQLAAAKKLQDATSLLATREKAVSDAQRARTAIGKDNLAALEKIALKQSEIRSLSQKDAEAAAQAKAQRDQMVAKLAQASGLSEQQVRQAANLVTLEKQRANAVQSVAAAENEAATAAARAAASAEAQQTLAQRGNAAAGRLGGLALGLVAGTIGGALVSGVLSAGIDKATELLDAMINPAKKAEEALGDVAKAVDDIASKDHLDRLSAAKQLIADLGPTGTAPVPGIGSGTLGGNLSADALAQAAALDEVDKKIADYQKYAQEASHIDELRAQRIQTLTDVLTKASPAWQSVAAQIGDYARVNQAPPQNLIDAQKNLDDAARRAATSIVDQTLALKNNADAQREAAAATDEYIAGLNQESITKSVSDTFDAQIATVEGALDAYKQSQDRLANYTIERITREATQQINNISDAADKRIAGLQRQEQNLKVVPSARTNNLQGQLDALKDAQPSKRTNELAAAIERLNKAQEKAQYQSQLASIDEQRHQILLAQRLAQTKTAIDLDRYQGKDRITAIDALLDRMQKQNEAQALFNKLLDIQYNIQRGVHREQGETIQDFIARRAQYYREQLQQAAELRSKGPQADLEAEKQKIQTSLQLKDLEAQKRKLIEDHARQEYLKSLQDQLQASRDRDQKELQSRRDSLQKQLQASKDADQAALDHKRQALQDEIDRIRQNAQDSIDAINKRKEADIQAAQNARDANIKAMEARTQATIDGLRAQAEQVSKWTNIANIMQLDAAVKGANTMEQLQRLEGAVSGLQWSLNYVYQTSAASGMDPAARQALLNSYVNTIHDYQSQILRLSVPIPKGILGFGLAEGGFFTANNANTPVGKDVRWGDAQGDELGFMFNNKVVQMLRDQQGGSGPLVDTINVGHSTGDFYRDKRALERLVIDLVRQEIKH